jgi:hypothetical protein
MPLSIVLIPGAVLVGAFALCAIACLFRNWRVAMGTEVRRGPTVTFSLSRGELAAARGRAAATVEPALAESFSGLNKAQAEELLDWLEANGYCNCEVSFAEQTGFTVRLR